MVKVVGIGEYAISSNEEDIIKTYALGSCVALVVYNLVEKKAGMVHIALPDSNIDRDNRYNSMPGYFADTAVPLILDKVLGKYLLNNTNYKVSLYGGAFSKNNNDIFNIGIKNVSRIREILINNNVKFDNANTGGYFSRTIELDARTGNVIVSAQPMKI